MRIVAVITARGGSKRIPKKNIKEFCGKPLISYPIRAAVESGLFDEVMVSTDSREIAQIAVSYGAAVPFYRSAETSDDYATTSEVLLEVFRQYQKQGISFDYAYCIYPTAVFITKEILRKAMHIMRETDADTVLPVVPFSYPPQRGMLIRQEQDGCYARMREPEYINTRSQDLDKIYHDSGQFYCFRIGSFQERKNLMSGKIAPLVVSEMEAQDIDTMQDFEIAQIKFRRMQAAAMRGCEEINGQFSDL